VLLLLLLAIAITARIILTRRQEHAHATHTQQLSQAPALVKGCPSGAVG
jgi:hypothetical protein